ncbi:hypothetical protein N7493_012107 [Penicillium malachiteum]|uniref:Uncharacterized protein n=1 Tax=Penicillium malachiteum TaxID=1324776 RepID=A0AAD6MPR6_9EURO|nr:hypothetical protein N7493_012107 [Penicillium malachiteum]
MVDMNYTSSSVLLAHGPVQVITHFNLSINLSIMSSLMSSFMSAMTTHCFMHPLLHASALTLHVSLDQHPLQPQASTLVPHALASLSALIINIMSVFHFGLRSSRSSSLALTLMSAVASIFYVGLDHDALQPSMSALTMLHFNLLCRP